MKNYVIFNGKSTEDIALIEELPVVSRAERDIEFIEIDGRHGFLTFDKNRYKPVDYSIELKVNILTKKIKSYTITNTSYNSKNEVALSILNKDGTHREIIITEQRYNDMINAQRILEEKKASVS